AIPAGPMPTPMSVGFLVLVFTSIVDTVSLSLFATRAVARHLARAVTAGTSSGTTPTSEPANPNTTSPRTQRFTVPCLAIRLGHRRHGVTATPTGYEPTGMSVEALVLVFTLRVDTESLAALATSAVLPSGAIATPAGCVPTATSTVLVLVFT